MDNLNSLYDLMYRLMDELDEMTEKVAQGDISKECLDVIDKLTHSIKSLKTTIAMCEQEEQGGSYEGGSYEGSYDGGGMSGRSYRSYANGNGSYNNSYRMSERRGRNQNNGRYMSRGYSGEGNELAQKLQEAMNFAPDTKTREQLQRMVQEAQKQG